MSLSWGDTAQPAVKSKPKAQTHFAVTVIAMIQTHHSYFRQTGPSPTTQLAAEYVAEGTTWQI